MTLHRAAKLVILPIAFVGILIFIKSIDYLTPDFEKGFLIDKEHLFDGIYALAFYGHVFSSIPALFLGSVQAFFRIEKKFPAIHRWIGTTYSVLIILAAAPGATVMAFHAIDGWASTLSFLVPCALWFLFTLQGYRSMAKGKIRAHREFMTRSYLLTVFAILQRVFLFVHNHYSEWQYEHAYAVIIWLSWVPALLAYEGSLYWKKRKMKLGS